MVFQPLIGIGSEHAACVRRLSRFLIRNAEPQALVSAQNPVRLNEASEPEPDLALLRPREDDYASRHPQPDDVFLVVEVADTSLSFDRDVKLPLYAAAGIPEAWIVDLEADEVHVYREPDGERYATHETCSPGDEIRMTAHSELESIPVDQILGT